MIPFLNIKLYKDSFQNLAFYVDKMRKQELTIEDILEVDDLVSDIKHNSNTEFLPFFTNAIIKKLIDYCTKKPIKDTQSIGYKYPFNSCQLLSSDNTAIMHHFMNSSSRNINQITESEEERGLIICTFEQYKYCDMTEGKGEDVSMIIKSGSRDFSKVTYHNLDYFLSFLNENLMECEVNLVLSGYFSEIFVHLLEVKGDTIIKYIFTYRLEVLDDLLKNVQFKSINECISHILLFTSDDTDDFQLMTYKHIFLEKILLKLSDNTKGHIYYESLCEMLVMTLSSKKVYKVLLTYGPCINLLFQILFKAKESKVHLQAIIQLITSLNDVILSLFKKRVTENHQVENLVNIQEIYGLGLCLKITKYLPNEDNTHPYNILTEDNLGLIIKTIYHKGLVFLKDIINGGNTIGTFNVNSNTTYNMKQEVLGINRLIQLKYFRSLLDLVINSYANDFFVYELNGIIDNICNKGILINSIDYFFKFQFNTLYQNVFIQIVSIIVNGFSPQKLIEHFFIQGEVFQKIIGFFLNKALFTFNSKRTMLNGCFAPLIQICNLIVQSSNQWVKCLISSNKDFRALYKILIKDVNKKYNSKLFYAENPESKKNRSYVINNITQEVKNSSFSNYTIYELINEEIELFKLYMEGHNVKAQLDAFRLRLLSLNKESEDISIGIIEISLGNEKESLNNSNINKEGNLNDTSSHNDESINTNLDSRSSFDLDVKSSVLPMAFLSKMEGIGIRNDNYYYDNSYWSYQNNLNQPFSIESLLNE